MWLNLYLGAAGALFTITYLLFLLRGKGTFDLLHWALISALVAVPATGAIHFLDQVLHFL